jgi:hypothetical protein
MDVAVRVVASDCFGSDRVSNAGSLRFAE